MTKVKWGVLGCANFARKRTIPAMLASPSVDLAGVASRSTEKAEAFRAEFGLARAYSRYEDMLDDPSIEAVYIPLPNGLHAEWTIRAVEQGKHVLCEKPFTADAAEAERVAEAVRRAGVNAMEAFMWRFHPQHARAREVIDAGVIGAVQLVRGVFTFPIAPGPNVRLRGDLAGGSVMDVGCYPISGARFYFAGEPSRAYARGEIDPQRGVDMRVSGLLEFPEGRTLFDCGFNLPFRNELEIVGEKGVIQFPRAWLPDEEALFFVDGQPERLPAANQYVNEFEHVSICLREGLPTRHGPEDAVRQMRVLDAVRRSIRSGAPEEV
jgi:xylose dehydrogenase (NAD/NADP)